LLLEIPREWLTLDEAIEFVKTHYKYKKVEFPQTSEYYRFPLYQARYLKERKGLTKRKMRIDASNGVCKVIYYSHQHPRGAQQDQSS
jgi:hypothetical protein